VPPTTIRSASAWVRPGTRTERVAIGPTSGRPKIALRGRRFRPSQAWGPGIYRAPVLLRAKLIVVSELPVRRDTLLVRLMGAGRTLEHAAAELLALPEDALATWLADPHAT
jgi:hypothetical protein